MRLARVVVLVLVLLVVACGGSDQPAVEGTVTAADIHENGGRRAGSFTIMVADQDWTFDSVQCTFAENDAFALTGTEDGLAVSVTRDALGSSITLGDADGGDDPAVSYASLAETVGLQIAGTSLSGIADFLDATATAPVQISGTFAGTCP